MGRKEVADVEPAAGPSRFQRVVKKAWWLHSFGALSFGLGVMIFARKGLEYADEILMVLGLSWLLMFVALRFIVGPSNRAPEERFTRKGVRIVTNYVIKNLYQQMFFFSVPLYAASATWSLSSYNWWLPPVLLVCAVLSTMDLILDNVIMEHRGLASMMYGLALFAVLNLMLPVVFGLGHFHAVLVSAGATAPAVALLTFRIRSVLTTRGLALTAFATATLMVAAWFGRGLVPPAPLALADGAVGHGTESSYECLPGEKRVIRADQLDRLRCGSEVTEPGGIRDEIVHTWRHRGKEVARIEPESVEGCAGHVERSYLPAANMPGEPVGKWECRVETEHGQLVGVMRFEVVPGEKADQGERGPEKGRPEAPRDAGAGAGADAAARTDAAAGAGRGAQTDGAAGSEPDAAENR